MKRLVYPLALVLLLLGFAPLMLMLALGIAATSGLPIVFKQKRMGKDGAVFTMYKFRTMVRGAEKQKSLYQKLNESAGPAFKIYDDPRFTPLGKVLSHTGLDELPQLWNVLRGDMALIGPRPLPVSEAKKLAPWMRKRHAVKPGIISPAVLTGRYHSNFDDWMKSDVSYAAHKSPAVDVLLVARFIPFLLRLFAKEALRMVRI